MDGSALFILTLVALTSGVLYAVGTRRLGLAAAGLRPALGRTLEAVGLAVAFGGLNLATGFLSVLALRALSGRFVSLYLNTDPTLLFLSLVQALVFQWWRAERSR